MSDSIGIHVAEPIGTSQTDFAKLVALHAPGQVLIERRTPPVRSDLNHAFVASSSLDHLASLVDRDGQRFFNVHVLAGVAGVDCLNGVPVIRRGDHHGIDVFTFHYFSEVTVGSLASATFFLGLGQGSLVDIAQRHDLCIVMFHESIDQLASAVGHADES